jgi:hypothetical protein
LLVQISDELPTAGTGQASSLGLEAVTTGSVIEDDLVEIQDAAGSVATASGRIVSKTLAWVMRIWKRSAKWLWNLISHLLTPKEWSFTGGIGMPGLVNASISVTFG